jgi:hypothetical protein
MTCANNQIEWRITTNGELFRIQSRNCRCEEWADESEGGARIARIAGRHYSFFVVDPIQPAEFKSYSAAEKHLRKKYGEQVNIIARTWRPA